MNSFGFGGTNGHAILEAAPETKPVVRTAAEPADGRAWLLPISARSEPALSDLARSYLDSLAHERGLKSGPLRDICYSASVKRSHHDFRLALVAHDRAELAEQLEAARSGRGACQLLDRPHREHAAAAVFVCSGMGQQWWAMGRELLSQEPVFRRAVEEVSELFASARRLVAAGEADRRRDRFANSGDSLRAAGDLCVAGRACGTMAIVGHRARRGVGPQRRRDGGDVYRRRLFPRGRRSRHLPSQPAAIPNRRTGRDAGGGNFPRRGGAAWSNGIRAPSRSRRSMRLRSVTLSGDAAVLAEIDKTLNASRTSSAARCRWTFLITARRWSSSRRSCSNACARSGRSRHRRRSSLP